MQDKFDFEKLEVWVKAVEFAEVVIGISENLHSVNRHFRIIEQLESAATSVSMNIAEGKGRYSSKEFLQFLYYSRGSINEVVTLITILHKRQWISDTQYQNIYANATQLS